MNIEEFRSNYNIRKLDIGERVSAFSCGDEDLDDFILNDAHLYRDTLLAVTYVIERNTDKIVVGYFSLANDRITIKDFSSRNEFNRFRRHRFVNEKRLTGFPSVKLCRFALCNTVKGQHMGSILLDFMKNYFISGNKTGCRFLTVDAYQTAEPFYLKNGFLYLNEDDKGYSTRLMFYDLLRFETAL